MKPIFTFSLMCLFCFVFSEIAARTLVNYFRPDEEFDDVPVCAAEGYWRKAKELQYTGNYIRVKINGNPISITSTFEFPFPTEELAFCDIIDLNGKSIMQLRIPENSLTYHLGKLNLQNGAYIYKIRSEKYYYSLGKIIVLK
jgi:hypothetical protein